MNEMRAHFDEVAPAYDRLRVGGGDELKWPLHRSSRPVKVGAIGGVG